MHTCFRGFCDLFSISLLLLALFYTFFWLLYLQARHYFPSLIFRKKCFLVRESDPFRVRKSNCDDIFSSSNHNFFNPLHCVKSVQIRSYFWSVFSCIRIEYGDLLQAVLLFAFDMGSFLDTPFFPNNKKESNAYQIFNEVIFLTSAGFFFH